MLFSTVSFQCYVQLSACFPGGFRRFSAYVHRGFLVGFPHSLRMVFLA